jgi:hypothetical protein
MNVFIVPSCIKTEHGLVDVKTRFNETIKTFDSIRENMPDALIVFIDNSKTTFTETEHTTIRNKVNMFISLHNDLTAQQFNIIPSVRIAKSAGETYMLISALKILKNHIDFKKEKGRVFKIGGRCILEKSFDISHYEHLDGKYVFKTRVPSWLGQNFYYLDTRLYSWCFSLVDEYLDILENKNLKLILNEKLILNDIDTEHSHFINIEKEKLIEFNKIHVGCVIASTGNYISE